MTFIKSRMPLLPLLLAVVSQSVFVSVVDGAFVVTSIPYMTKYCGSIHSRHFTTNTPCHTGPPTVWIEDAEDGFVDDEENLEEGEICLKSIKAFASSSSSSVFHNTDDDDDNGDDDDDEAPRFLSAGALVQRPIETRVLQNGESSSSVTSSSSIIICDAWMADSVLDHGGPNLQVEGALQVLDDLFLFVLLERHRHRHVTISDDNSNNEHHQHTVVGDASIRALQRFVVQCGQNNVNQEHNCASFMATKARGFVPLKDAVSVTSIYSPHHYDNNFIGMVLDPVLGRRRYHEAVIAAGGGGAGTPLDDSTATASSSSTTVKRILDLLPDEATLKRHSTKRFSLKL